MVNDRPPDLAAGGVCVWRLPTDETGPAVARSLLQRTMARLGLDRDVIEDGRLAVSETATNALRHARQPSAGCAPVPPELWVWARVPAPQLVVSVFDHARTALSCASGADLLDEYGKGLALLGKFTAEWGTGPSRSRLADHPVPGKTVWFALPLPAAWPGRALRVGPDIAARCLLHALKSCGFSGRRSSDRTRLSVLELPGLNVWVRPGHFCWRADRRRYVQHPLIDLQETAEHLVRHLDAAPFPAPTALRR